MSFCNSQIEQYMLEALELAKLSANINCVPVGAIILDCNNNVIGKGFNTKSPTEHAEINAINDAFNFYQNSNQDLQLAKRDKLQDCTLITTLEPCIMCAGAILNSQIERVYFGAWDEKFGATGSVWDLLRDPLASHHPEVFGGICGEESQKILQDWFSNLRESRT